MKTKERVLWWLICGMAVLVLGVSVWAVIQEIHMDKKEKTVQVQKTPAPEIPQEKEVVIQVTKLANSILSTVKFETKLSKMKEEVAKSMVTPSDKSTKVLLYMGEGTCADELLIVTAQSEKKAKTEMVNVRQHLKDMKQSFQDYLPKQADKVDKAVIKREGKYIIACVCSSPDQIDTLIKNAEK